jgi:hypothetical protein
MRYVAYGVCFVLFACSVSGQERDERQTRPPVPTCTRQDATAQPVPTQPTTTMGCEPRATDCDPCEDPGFSVGLQVGNAGFHVAYQAPTISLVGVRGPAGVLWSTAHADLRRVVQARKSNK